MQRTLKQVSLLSIALILLVISASPTSALPGGRKAKSRSKVATKKYRLSARARQRAEAARRRAMALERARTETLRSKVQTFIANDDLTGEDPEVRRVALNALGYHAGTVVVMDPKTGRIYTIVNQEWAVREGFKPCSTIKLVTGLAGLNENVIDPADTTNVSDDSRIDLTSALAYSKNRYFQRVGGEVGFDKMISYARLLGFGEKTGINVRFEFPGRVPDPKSAEGVSRMSSHGDDFEVTAVQLATLVSAMGNGGKLLTPYIARSLQEEEKLQNKVRRQIDLDPTIWRYMVPGMVGAVNYGSGRRAYDSTQTVAGKTGTCREDGRWVGLFTSYAPLANPRLAVVVITRGADARGHFPASVAGRIYRDLNGRFGTPGNVQLATARSEENYLVDNEDTEVDEDSADENDDRWVTRPARPNTRNTGVSRQPWWNDSKVKRVLMPFPKKADVRSLVQPEVKPSGQQ